MAAPTSTSATITSANETRNCASNAEKEVDIYRDTPIRYLGYANEVGESFRALIPKSAVWATYGIASAYVLADARHKGQVAAKLNWPDDSTKKQKVMHAVGDTIVWQGLASVMIPGFTIKQDMQAFSLHPQQSVQSSRASQEMDDNSDRASSHPIHCQTNRQEC